MLHELAAEHFGLDTKVARTIGTLIRYPGRLTVEVLAGRRARYLPPLRLYLSLSVLFFLCSAFQNRIGGNSTGVVRFNTSGTKGSSRDIISFDTTTAQPSPVSEAVDSAGLKHATTSGIPIDTMHGNALELFFKRRLDRRATYLQGHKTEATARISDAFQHDLPDALFLLVPGLAFALMILYHGSNRYFAEHLVFALHFQAFGFAAFTIGLLPIPLLGTITGTAVLVYLFLSLQRVYRESIALTAAKFAAIVVGYGISLAIIMSAVALTAFLFA